MAYYTYKVKDDTGRNLFGLMEASNKREVQRKLSGSNLFFISANLCNRDQLFKKRVKFQTLIMFTHRLTSLIEAGVPLLKAFTILWRQSEDPTIQLVVSHMRARLEEGDKISSSLDDFPHIFPPLYRALIRVGETSGVLVSVLRKLSEYLEYKAATMTRIKKAMTYPLIVIVFSIIVVIAMFMFVVPTFENVLMKLNVDLPILTRFVIGLSQFIRSWFFAIAIILLIILGIVAYKYVKNTPSLAYQWDKAILRIPYFGKILQTISLSQFTRSFGILLGAGVPILESFDVAGSTATNRKLVYDIREVKGKVEIGTSLYDSFQRTTSFPILLVEMIGVGETSGMLVTILEKVTKHFDEESDYHLNRFITFLEPALLIFVGLIVILTLLAVYMPVVSIWQGLMTR